MIDGIEVHGHRGSRGTHVENTFPGFEEAARAGAHYVEMDLQLSADDVPVVFHDASISGRICHTRYGKPVKHPVPVRDLKAAQIKEFFCGTYVDPRFPEQELTPGTRIPLLEEVFSWQKESAPRLGLNLEIKMKPVGRSPQVPAGVFAKAVADVVRRHDLHRRVLLQSFQKEVLDALREIDRDLRTARLFRWDSRFIEKIRDTGLTEVTLHHRLLSRERMDHFRRQGVRVLSYTVNRESSWKKLAGYGVHGLITDYPARLVEYLRRGSA